MNFFFLPMIVLSDESELISNAVVAMENWIYSTGQYIADYESTEDELLKHYQRTSILKVSYDKDLKILKAIDPEKLSLAMLNNQSITTLEPDLIITNHQQLAGWKTSLEVKLNYLTYKSQLNNGYKVVYSDKYITPVSLDMLITIAMIEMQWRLEV
jgi:hypothetical protein